MRITAELLTSQAEHCTNPLGERELVLSGLGIPDLENMGAARDDFDCYNLNNNRLVRLHNFPRLQRIQSLLVAGNHIASVDAHNLGQNVPNLECLVLRNNSLSSLLELKSIGTCCKKLEFLDLTGNPVTRRPYYRYYAIHHIPSLKTLDFTRIRKSERETAQRWALSAAGAALESDLLQQQQQSGGTSNPNTADGFVVTSFSAAEKEQIRNLLANAASVEEVEAIEASVRKGVLPDQLREERPLPPAKRQKTTAE